MINGLTKLGCQVLNQLLDLGNLLGIGWHIVELFAQIRNAPTNIFNGIDNTTYGLTLTDQVSHPRFQLADFGSHSLDFGSQLTIINRLGKSGDALFEVVAGH